MLTALFYYSLLVLLACGMTASTCLSAYFVTHRRSNLFLVAAFLVYFLDGALVYQDDFVSNTGAFSESSFWLVGHPVASALTGAAAIGFLWLFALERLGVRGRTIRLAPVAALAGASLVSWALVPDERVREFLYFSPREFFLFGMYAYLTFKARTADDVMRARLGRLRRPLLVALALTCLTLAENVYFMLLFDPTRGMPDLVWFFAERNVSENLLFLWFAYLAVRESAEILSLRFEAPPTGGRDSVTASIEAKLPVYAKVHDLSPRETEVMRALLDGKDNQNIASEMGISPATVKVHVHNVLKKTGQPNRQELQKAFWSE